MYTKTEDVYVPGWSSEECGSFLFWKVGCKEVYHPSEWIKEDFLYSGERGVSGGRGGNGGRAGCGGVNGYGGQSVIIAYQNRMNENKTSSSSANLGQQGQRGKVGHGGKNGDTAMIKYSYSYHFFGLRLDTVKYFTAPADKTYADSGIVSTDCSLLFNKPSVPSKPIALFQLETEYLNFMNERHSALIHSSLMNRSFLNHIMNRRSKYGQALLTF